MKHNYFSVNIILELMDYKVYECVLSDHDNNELEKSIIAKDTLTIAKGSTIETKYINNEVLQMTRFIN